MKTILCVGMAFLFCVLCIGFASLNDSLEISGNVSADAALSNVLAPRFDAFTAAYTNYYLGYGSTMLCCKKKQMKMPKRPRSLRQSSKLR